MKEIWVKCVWLGLIIWLSASGATFAQSGGLYIPPQRFTMVTLDGYTVRDAAHNRDIPIFIRYPKEAAGQLPMILWSHGGGPQTNGQYHAEEWGAVLAQSGYLVIHMSHVPRTSIEIGALYTEYGVPANQRQDAFGPLEVDRPRDAKAVLDDLDNIENFFPAIKGRINRNAIGVAGHSFGSYTAMTLAGGRVNLIGAPGHADDSFLDPRPRAFLALSPQGPGRLGWKEDSYREINRPVMFATGLGDSTSGEQAPSRVRAHRLLAPGDNYLLFINRADANHETFNLQNHAQLEFNQWIASTGVAWFDAALKGLPAARNFLTSGRTETASNNVATIDQRAVAPAVTSVSAANYLQAWFASAAIHSAFGANLAALTQAASSTPLPTQLAGTSVKVKDSAGVERFAPLFFVSPSQINYQLPPGTATGLATITFTNANANLFIEQGIIFPTNPGLFTADASGAGIAAAVVLRVKPGGAQSYEPVARFDSAQNKFVAVLIDPGPVSDQVFLILFGTGIRNNSSGRPPTAQIGGVNAPVTFAGAQGELTGLDQVNLLLPPSLAGRGEVDVVLTIDGQTANVVKISIK
ncbi:MAG: hypothetical protein AB7U82_25150 [Blastocatellales bacterium]